jgi:subtilisin-like proprotein convertase family protein
MHARRTSRLAMAVAVGGLACAAPASAADGLSRKAASQIASLQEIKASLTPAERKLDSRLAVLLRQRRDRSVTAGAPKVQTGVAVTKSGGTEVDIGVDAVDAALLQRLDAVGAHVRHASTRLRTIRADVPLDALTQVAGWKDVRRIDVAVGFITAHEVVKPVPAETKEQKAARLEAQLEAALADQGPVVSEGDVAHAADVARTRRHVTGTGVKVCALSDGVDSLEAEQAKGELPAVDVLPGQAGDGDEGTAMLEIVHDLAPNAELGFATVFDSAAEFADNILALRADAGCDIIVDDVLYFSESPFQDGPIAQAVDAVTADGALYFSSAGNDGNTLDGTSGNYEGDFVDSGRPVGKFRGNAHDFDPGPGVQAFDPLLDSATDDVPVTLFWADPLGAAADDYDLYLFDASGNVVFFSQDVQDGDDDPWEILFTPLFGGEGLRLAVVKFSGADRYFQLSALGGRFATSGSLVGRSTPGVTRGHSAAVNAFSVAAAPAAAPFRVLEPGDPPSPSGPFPNPFTRRQLPERFTSDGPRRVFFEANGAPITPGNFSSTGGTVRRKPDITAADGVHTGVPAPFSPFFGTSAAAPHAAAIAALVLSGNPGFTTADLRPAFDATALDLRPAGFDDRTGAGVLRADRVLAFTGATPQPLVKAGTAAVTPLTGDGDAFLEPGETADVALPATNVGDARATGVNVTLSTDDPQATITPRSRSYGGIAPGETRSRNYTLTLARDYPAGKPVALAVRVTFVGVLSPTSATQLVRTGEPTATATTFAYTGPPVAIPDNDDAGVSVTIPVSGIGYASNVTFSIDGTTCTTTEGATTVGIDHTFVGDLTGTLRAPGGATATLFDGSGGGGNNMCQVVFDDAAADPFDSVTSALAPFTGTWRPDSPLAAVLAAPADGTWTFSVADGANLDVGSIRAVSLHIRGFVRD